MNIILNAFKTDSLREKAIIFMFEHSKNAYKKWFKKKQMAWTTSRTQLRQYEEGSLGKDLAIFLTINQFELEAKFEKHDIYHVLTDYTTTVVGEICLSIFLIANGKRSIYTRGVAFVGSIAMIEHFKLFKAAYLRGKYAHSIAKWQFEHLLKENTNDLKKQIFKQKHSPVVVI